MKIDFAQELKTIDGSPLMRNKNEGGVVITLPATLKWAAVEALLGSESDKLTGEEKGQRYELALTVQAATEPVDLPIEFVCLIRKLCDEFFAPLIVGQTRRLLDAKSD